MRDRNKGFTLVELMITVAVLAIGLSFAIPSFTSSLNNAKADTEIGDLYRALNLARLEAINRAKIVRVTPNTAGTWNGSLTVQTFTSGAADLNGVVRVIPAMATSAVVTASNAAYIEFNNLGALSSPATAVAIAYTRGAATRSIGVCLTGRLVLGGTCP